jgi:hypothetical protein
MQVFAVCCPLIPLLKEGGGYPPGYSLPLRQRPQNSLDIRSLCGIFRDSLLYESISPGLDLAVVGVLSPYTALTHVMVTELSPGRYLPGPESFTECEFALLLNVCGRVLSALSHNSFSVQCMGFNWSPFSWGAIEERGGCQSVMTKFHMMLWQWNDLSLETRSDLSPSHQHVYELNQYNGPFAELVLLRAQSAVDRSGLFDRTAFTPRGLFLGFREGRGIADVTSVFLREFAIIVQSILKRLSGLLVEIDFDELLSILNVTCERKLTDEELLRVRSKPKVRDWEAVAERCENEREREICQSVYAAVVNRCNDCDEREWVWTKGFGFSMTICDSAQREVVEPGLYLGLHAVGGAGGAAEIVRCYLTRPLERLADEALMIEHNRLLWKLARDLQ